MLRHIGEKIQSHPLFLPILSQILIRRLVFQDAHLDFACIFNVILFFSSEKKLFVGRRKILLIEIGGKRRVRLFNADDGGVEFLDQAAAVAFGRCKVEGLRGKFGHGAHSLDIIHAGIEEHVRPALSHGLYLFLRRFTIDVLRFDQVHHAVVLKFPNQTGALPDGGHTKDLVYLGIDLCFLHRFIGHLKQGLRDAVAVACIIVQFPQALTVHHGAHQVDFPVLKHFQQRAQALVNLTGNLHKFIFPAGILRHLFQIFIGVSGVVSIFIKIGKPGLNRVGHPDHTRRCVHRADRQGTPNQKHAPKQAHPSALSHLPRRFPQISVLMIVL